MKLTAQQLAQRGRYGDTELLHVSRDELAALRGLGSLAGIKMTQNPDTGLPEAFNFKSLIPAIVGIGATVASGGTLSPLTAGLISGATTTAVTGDIRQGLASGVMGGMLSGVGTGLAEMGGAGAGAAAQAGTEAAQQAAAGSLGSGMAGMGTDQLVQQGVADQLGQQAMSNTMSSGVGSLGSGMSNIGLESGLNAGLTEGMSSGVGSLANVGMPAGAEIGQGAIAANVPQAAGFSAEKFGQNLTNGDAWKSAFGGEHLKGRVLPGLMAGSQVMQNAMMPDPEDAEEEMRARNAPSGDAAREKFSTRKYLGGPKDNYYAETGSGEPSMFKYAAGGPVAGGIAGLPNNVDSGMMKVIRAIRGRYRSRKAAEEDMQVRGSFMNKMGLRDPNDPLLDYAFGYTAKQGKKKPRGPQLVQQLANGGPVMGAGDGMSDSIPAQIDGEQPAELSSGEHVIPADAVSHLGNGSTEAGHKALYDMIARVRQARTGNVEQAPAIDPNAFMPS